VGERRRDRCRVIHGGPIRIEPARPATRPPGLVGRGVLRVPAVPARRVPAAAPVRTVPPARPVAGAVAGAREAARRSDPLGTDLDRTAASGRRTRRPSARRATTQPGTSRSNPNGRAGRGTARRVVRTGPSIRRNTPIRESTGPSTSGERDDGRPEPMPAKRASPQMRNGTRTLASRRLVAPSMRLGPRPTRRSRRGEQRVPGQSGADASTSAGHARPVRRRHRSPGPRAGTVLRHRPPHRIRRMVSTPSKRRLMQR
jgi:hypothetical protein